MSPPSLELTFDVQKYVGSSLIAHKSLGKKYGNSAKYINNDNRDPSSAHVKSVPSPSNSIRGNYLPCDCCLSYNPINSAWTGMPLFNLASGKKIKSGKNSHSENLSRISETESSARTSGVTSCFKENMNSSNSVSPFTEEKEPTSLSKLALHTQGVPLIVSNSSVYNRWNQVISMREDALLSNRSIKNDKNNARKEHQLSGPNVQTSLMQVKSKSSPSVHSVLYLTHNVLEDISIQTDAKYESGSYLPNSSTNDCMSVTSEESSGLSESNLPLPRIIKPRKRKKKERKMTLRGCSGALVTLKPYTPLCYKFTDDKVFTSDLPESVECDETKKEDYEVSIKFINFETEDSENQQSYYPYFPSLFCTCHFCAPETHSLILSELLLRNTLSPFLTPPPSPCSSSSSVSPASSPPPSSCLASVANIIISDTNDNKLATCSISSKNKKKNLENGFIPVHYIDEKCFMAEYQNIEAFTQNSHLETIENFSECVSFTTKLTASHPPQRPWITLALADRGRPTCVFTVMCYNVLCDKYATRQMYGYCPNWALNWEYRRKGILDEIRHYSADIISLQEIETDQFYNFFLPELKRDGYNGIFSPKSRAKTMGENERKFVDGCAIFFRTTKFNLIKEHLVEFNQLAMANAEGSDDMLNRVMTKDNIGLAALLETKESAWENGIPPDPSQVHQPLLVCTAHIHWDPEYCDVKLIQTMMLMQELRTIVEKSAQSFRPGSHKPDSNTIPLMLCGDFNSLPDSGVIEFLTSGRVSVDHPDFKDLGYKACLRKLSSSEKPNEFTHSFKVARAYSEDVMPFTNYTFDFKGIIDYILYSKQYMNPLGLLGALDPEWLREHKVIGCPHPHIPSDHFSLLVEFEMSVPSTHPSLSNGLVLRR